MMQQNSEKKSSIGSLSEPIEPFDPNEPVHYPFTEKGICEISVQ